jgi:hypothetical protein
VKIRILFLVILLLLLLFAYALRYEQKAYTPAAQRYLDRWTGIEWVKSYTWEGTKRIPHKLLQDEYTNSVSPEKVKQELAETYQLDRIFTGGWALLVTLVLAFIYKAATCANKHRHH